MINDRLIEVAKDGKSIITAIKGVGGAA